MTNHKSAFRRVAQHRNLAVSVYNSFLHYSIVLGVLIKFWLDGHLLGFVIIQDGFHTVPKSKCRHYLYISLFTSLALSSLRF